MIRDITERFLETLKNTYYNNRMADVTGEFLRGECRLLSFLYLDTERRYLSGELADKLNITTARVASTLKSLEKKGYITRESSDDDKRKSYVQITESGKEYIENKRENVCGFFDEIFDKLGEDDTNEFIRIIEKMTSINDSIEREENTN